MINNDGYSEKHRIDEKDMHYGWVLGDFYLTGYTRQTTDENGSLVFLKTFGDDITLWYELKQNIKKLNGDKELKINTDKKAYDEHFGIKKTNFGKGTLIIQQTDYQNKVHDPVIYTDFLSAKVSQDAATEVEFLEEGDYEVALDYAIDNGHIIGLNKDYRWTFKFSVRNGNCMVFPKDVSTDAELNNTSITKNGFYLDLARSKYLDINITKEVLNEGANGLVEDVRFNRAAKDGEKYTDEGIYTIKVYNKYTDEQTIKKIYVGDNSLIKTYINTGYSLDFIKAQIDEGYTVSPEGYLIAPTEIPSRDLNSVDGNENNESDENRDNDNNKSNKKIIVVVVITILVLSVITTVGNFYIKKKARIEKEEHKTIEDEDK